MTTAREIVVALGGKWRGKEGTALCLAHNDHRPSLSITESNGRTLVICRAGCEQNAVIGALRARGLWGGQSGQHQAIAPEIDRQRQAEDMKRSAAALSIWRSAVPIVGTLAEIYLRARGIKSPHLPSIRFHPNLRYHGQDGPSAMLLPAMISAIQWPDRRIGAIQRTFLDPRGDRKAQVSSPRKTLGPFNGGALRLGPAGLEIGIAEGLETGLSAMQLFEVPVWCACGARLAAINLPATVSTVHVFADNGDPGHEAAERAATRYTQEGRCVVLRYPPSEFGDWNDVIRAEVAG